MSRKLIAVLLALVSTAVPASAQGIFSADSRIGVTSVIVSSTVAPIVVSPGPTMFYGIEGSSSILTPVFVKLYDAATVTCGSGTPMARYQIPPSTASPLQQSVPNGDAYGAGLVACITGGIGDSDQTAPAANSYTLNLHWKHQQ